MFLRWFFLSQGFHFEKKDGDVAATKTPPPKKNKKIRTARSALVSISNIANKYDPISVV
jgi:hypothetical protein